MTARLQAVAALVALAAIIIVASSPSNAGSPCCCAWPCVGPAPVAAPPPVVVYRPYELPSVYIVDQGPVYGGPGIYTNPTVEYPHPLPPYPYVGRTYPIYPGYYGPRYSPGLRARAQHR